MKRLFKAMLMLCLLMLALGGLLLWLLTDAAPTLPKTSISNQDVVQVQRMWRQHDPRRLRAGSRVLEAFKQREVTAGLDMLEHFLPYLSLDVQMQEGQLQGVASLTLQDEQTDSGRVLLPHPLVGRVPAWLQNLLQGRYINAKFQIQAEGEQPHLTRLSIGKISLPDRITQYLGRRVHAWLAQREDVGPLVQGVQRVTSHPGVLLVEYRVGNNVGNTLKQLVFSPADRARIAEYHARLALTIAQLKAHPPEPAYITKDAHMPRLMPLVRVLGPMFALAKQRAKAGDAAAENRAMLLVVGLYVAEKPINKLMSESQNWPYIQPATLVLQMRKDSAQHFMVSAMLAAWADTPLADAIGLFKELDDSQGGSGFSFADLAADRAGVRFGELAIGKPNALQNRMQSKVVDTDICPVLGDLPEDMQAAEFTQRFGGVEGAAFKAQRAEIERRVQALPMNGW